MEHIGKLAAHTLETARQTYSPGAVAYLAEEIEVRAAAWGLTCMSVEIRESAQELEAIAVYDARDDEGRPFQAVFRAPLVTVH